MASQMKSIVIMALMLWCVSARADFSASATATWTPVTARVDKTPLQPEEIKTYRLRYHKGADKPVIVDVADGKATVPNLGPGVYSFSLQVVDVFNIASDWSASFGIVVPSRPMAPVLTIKFSCTNGCSGEIVAP